jgi:cytochrome P450
MKQMVKEEDNHLAHGLDFALKIIVFRTAVIFHKYLPFINFESKVQQVKKEHTAETRKIFEKAKKRIENGSKEVSILRALLEAKNDDGTPTLTEQEIFDECGTIRGAGHETSGNTCCWALYLLAQDPERLKIARDEVNRIVGDKRVPTYDEIKKLDYIQAIVFETLRLYPTVPQFPREAAFDTKLGGYDVPKDSFVLVSQQSMNRNQKYWENPDDFIPERFYNAKEKIIFRQYQPIGIPDGNRYGFLPFGAGNRHCIGSKLANTELLMILATIIKNYNWTLNCAPNEVIPVADITLGPKYGLPFKITKL